MCEDTLDDEDVDDEDDELDDAALVVPPTVDALEPSSDSPESSESPDDLVETVAVLALAAVWVLAGDSRIAIAPPSATNEATLSAAAARRALRARGGRRRDRVERGSTPVCSSMHGTVRTEPRRPARGW